MHFSFPSSISAFCYHHTSCLSTFHSAYQLSIVIIILLAFHLSIQHFSFQLSSYSMHFTFPFSISASIVIILLLAFHLSLPSGISAFSYHHIVFLLAFHLSIQHFSFLLSYYILQFFFPSSYSFSSLHFSSSLCFYREQ